MFNECDNNVGYDSGFNVYENNVGYDSGFNVCDNNVGYDSGFNVCENNVINIIAMILLIIIVMYIHFFMILLVSLSLFRFDTTDHCVGMHSLQVNNYSNVLLLYLVYKSVINI